MLAFAVTAPVPWPLLMVLLAVLALACVAWVLYTAALAIEGIDAYPPRVEMKASVKAPRRPADPPTSLRARMKARLVCLRQGHDYTYTFRLNRPAHRCRACGHWRAVDVLTSYRGGFRA